MIGIGCIPYRGWSRVKTLLESIARRDPGVPREKMILAVWDDGSLIEEFLAGKESVAHYPVTVLRSNLNQGIAPSWNAVTRHLLERGAEQVFLFNDDIIVTDHWLGAAVCFLNENSHAGCVCWHQNFFAPEDTEALLVDPSRVFPREPTRGRPKREALYNGSASRPGRVPCPAGCAFGFTKTMWERTDGFPDSFVSFHEESQFSFTLTAQGFPSYVLNWPVVWHQLSATFAACPELKASSVMRRSRHLFSEAWDVPQHLRETPFEHVHPLTMSGVPAYALRWPTLDGPREDTDPRCECTLCQNWRRTHAS